MGRTISKEEIIKRINNLPDIKEYSIESDSIIGSTKKAIFIHKNCPENNNNDHMFQMIVKDFIGGQRCPLCAKRKRIISNTKSTSHTIRRVINDDTKLKKYIDRINSKLPDEYTFISLYDDNFYGVHTKVNIKHCRCGKTFSKRISDFLYNDQFCPECTGKGGHKKDIKETIDRIKSAGFQLVDYEISKNEPLYTHKKYFLSCLKCGEIQERCLNTIINLSGMCQCQSKHPMSKGEKIIKEILDEHGIENITHKTFDDMKYISTLRCDIYLPGFNSIIEYDGMQHFKVTYNKFYYSNLKVIRERDETKNNFCANNNINILRISYKEISKKKISKIILEFLGLDKEIDGKPYDGKLSRTVWVGGKSNYDEYVEYNSK